MRTPRELYFSLDEYQARLDALRSRMEANGLDVLLIHTPENLYYISGYQTPGYYWYQTLIVPVDAEPIFITRSVEETNVEGLTWVEDSRPYTDNDDFIARTAEALRTLKVADKRIGLEHDSWFFTPRDFLRLTTMLPNATIKDCSGLIEQGRMIKSPQELEYIRMAAKTADAAMAAGINATKAGANENEIAAAVHTAQILAGSEYTGLPLFITAGKRADLAHATWYRKTVENNAVMFFELVGCIHRYHASLFRAVYVGEPPDEVIKAAEVGIETLEMAKDFIKPGIRCGDVHALIQGNISTKLGIGKSPVRAGYSIGIAFAPDWGEGQIISFYMDDPRTLKAGMTFHLIPAVKIPKHGVFTTSDTIAVNANGCETLTTFPRKLYIQ